MPSCISQSEASLLRRPSLAPHHARSGDSCRGGIALGILHFEPSCCTRHSYQHFSTAAGRTGTCTRGKRHANTDTNCQTHSYSDTESYPNTDADKYTNL